MSCWNRRITALLAVLLICTLSACGQSQIPLDYGDETAFEADLNAGKNLVGKTVSFVAAELHPQSLYGYDIWAGEHLNFISSKNPDIEVGQTVTVKVTAVESVIGSWFIEYEKVDAAADENTIYAAVRELLTDPAAYHEMEHAVNPYGDGHASRYIADILAREL